QPELVAPARLVRADRREEVRREELELEAPVAADEAEAAAVSLRVLDGGGPVDLHAELPGGEPEPLTARRERHRVVCELRGAPLEQPPRLRGCQAAEVDAGDAGAVGEPAGRAGEDEPEADRGASEQREDAGPGPAARARGSAAAGTNSRRGRGHGPRTVAAATAAKTRRPRRRRRRG